MPENQSTELELAKNLHRLAKFGANIVDAHSCFIFLPSWVLAGNGPQVAGANLLALGGYHSLSQSVVEDLRIPNNSGLIGWVVRNERSIHVSPFERDSRTLGIYEDDQELKSFIGIPVVLEIPDGLAIGGQNRKDVVSVGAVVCDSKKSFAFSKLHGKLLENLADEVSNVVHMLYRSGKPAEDHWETFVQGANTLIDTLGTQAIEVIRVSCLNSRQIEQKLGTRTVFHQTLQVQKLIAQALPEHFPCCVMPNGDMLIALDRMMAGFYTNRIEALCAHVVSLSSLPFTETPIAHFHDSDSTNTGVQKDLRESSCLQFICFRKSFSRRAFRVPNIEQLAKELAGDILNSNFLEDDMYGYRRA